MDPITSIVSILDTIDAFPYFDKTPDAYRQYMRGFYYLLIDGYDAPFAYVRKIVVKGLVWPENAWAVNHEKRILRLRGWDFEERSARIQRTLKLGWDAGKVPPLRGWTKELIPVKTAAGEHVLSMDEAGAEIFGVVCEGVCLTAWTTTDQGRMYWVQRRSMSRRTFPGLFDNTAMGVLRASEDPLEGVVRETLEEAGLPEAYVRAHIRAFGTVSYHLTLMPDGSMGSLPHVQYVFEIELPRDMVPIPVDGEAQSFEMMNTAAVIENLKAKKFKPNLGAIWLDHFCRHQIITRENDACFDEIWARVHRKHDLFIL